MEILDKVMEMKITVWGLERQDEKIKSEIFDVLKQVIESGSYVLGENVKKFEESFSSCCGVKYGVGVNSGTDALILGLKQQALKKETK